MICATAMKSIVSRNVPTSERGEMWEDRPISSRTGLGLADLEAAGTSFTWEGLGDLVSRAITSIKRIVTLAIPLSAYLTSPPALQVALGVEN